ncbi:hypothetical protein T484DRAFT_1647799, partial [Baffinella frigidus]
LNPQPSTLNPQPSTLNPQPSTLNPQPSTLHQVPLHADPDKVDDQLGCHLRPQQRSGYCPPNRVDGLFLS